ncbi:TniQ family protein [Rhodoferax ferrireducens]|nr:TniQ family protein [Rhodoferax ferrireducens]
MTMLFRPTPLPEELDRGYLGRIKRINGFQSEKETVAAMISQFGMQLISRRELSCLELLSLMANQPLEQFARYHSTIPIRRAITSSLPDLPHGSTTRRSLLCNFGMVAVRPGAYFCTKCVSEDVAFHGVSYWRRDHQVPGQLWCPKHVIPLNYLENDEAFLRSPSNCIADAETVPAAWVDGARDNEHVSRFTGIASGLFERTSPLDVKFVALALRKRAMSLGLNTVATPVKNKPLLSDLIRDSFPAPWLATVFPSLVDKVKGQILNRVDGVLYMATSASSVWSYILAASVLYASADEALNGLFSARKDFIDEPKRKRSARGTLDRQVLVTAYIECKGRQVLVAERLALPLHQAVSMLREAGLPNLVLGRSDGKNSTAAADAFYLDEKSFDESARAGGLTASEMAALVRCSGVDFKSTLSAMAGQRSTRGTGVRRTRGLMPQEARNYFEKSTGETGHPSGSV